MGDLLGIAGQFIQKGAVTDVREFGSGNINQTFLVTLNSSSDRHFILQRINEKVFQRPDLVMHNMRLSTEHLLHRLKQKGPAVERRWEVPALLPAKDGRSCWIDSDGSFWRALRFIEGAQSFDRIRNSDHAREVGYALGLFHSLLEDLPADSLFETLPGFHITPLYMKRYEAVSRTLTLPKTAEVNYCRDFIHSRRKKADILEQARAEGRLKPRTIHGDPKVNNILMDIASLKAISIVDLDTVMPGLVQYDIGDCLRSACNPLGEDPDRWEDIRFETDLCRAVLQGYFTMAKGFLDENDFAFLYESVRLIAFELGLRFFTDYLEGNVYFRIRYPEHNLVRALVQFRLVESIESEEPVIHSIVRDLK